MRTLAGIAATPTPLADPLPDVFPIFAEAAIRPRRGATTMIVATPGSAKSFLMLKWVIDLRLPTLYFAADDNEATLMARGAAISTGEDQSKIRHEMRKGTGIYQFDQESGEIETYADHLAEAVGHIRFNFESDPTYYDLEAETAAFAEVHGDFPQVIVVDTLMKVVGENENEWSAIRQVTKVLERLNRVTGAAVFVVHHMGDLQKDPSRPSPRKDIQGKVSQTPGLILSTAMDKMTGEIRVAKVKDSWSSLREDATGEDFVSMWVDLDTGQFYRSKFDRDNGINQIRRRR